MFFYLDDLMMCLNDNIFLYLLINLVKYKTPPIINIRHKNKKSPKGEIIRKKFFLFDFKAYLCMILTAKAGKC